MPSQSIASGVVGGWLGYKCLRWVAGSPPRRDVLSGAAYRNVSKVETLLGSDIWTELRDKVVLDFGTGSGAEAIEMAKRGAGRVIGLDIREGALETARANAANAGVADRCVFTTHFTEPVDAVVSLDSFEHFEDPAAILRTIRRLLKPSGHLFVSFGPPWFHPYGGHLFSVFPWAHLVFTERALMRWRSEFKTDGATRFSEVTGGLNGMTVRRFERLVQETGYRIERLEAISIRRWRIPQSPLLRELFTSTVRCRLVAQ